MVLALGGIGCKRPPLQFDAGSAGALPDGSPSAGNAPEAGADAPTPIDTAPSDADADASCGLIKQVAAIVPVSILVLVDQSVAGDQARWADVITALSSVVAANGRRVDWGLYAFPGPGRACAAGTVPGAVEIPLTPMNASAVADGIVATRTDGNGAPTAAAIAAGAAYLRALSASDGARFMLLAADHAPSCAGPDGTLAGDPTQAQADAVAALTAAAAEGFKTIVLAPSTTAGSDADALNALAQAGGLPQGPSGPAFATESTLAHLFQPEEVDNCIANLPAAPDGSHYLVTSVVVNGQTVPRDTQHVSGWDFTAATSTTIQFYGAWCQLLNSSRMIDVDIHYACVDTR